MTAAARPQDDGAWHRFVVDHGHRARGSDLAFILGRPIDEIQRLRAAGVCSKGHMVAKVTNRLTVPARQPNRGRCWQRIGWNSPSATMDLTFRIQRNGHMGTVIACPAGIIDVGCQQSRRAMSAAMVASV